MARKLKIVESDWGGPAYEFQYILPVYGIEAESERIESREQFLRALEEARTAPHTTLLLVSRGLLNQLGDELFQLIPQDKGGLRVLWHGVEARDRPADEPRVLGEEKLAWAALKLLGESPETLQELMQGIDSILRPRFDAAVLSASEFFCYDAGSDLELHLPVAEAKDHWMQGTLRPWLEGILEEAESDL